MTTDVQIEPVVTQPRKVESLNSNIDIVVENSVVKDIVVTGSTLTYEELREALELGQKLFDAELLKKALEDN